MNAHLKNPEHRRGFTTVYLADESAGKDGSGKAKGQKPIHFFRGKAQVEPQDHRHLKDVGLV
jgi:hypothetical protein